MRPEVETQPAPTKTPRTKAVRIMAESLAQAPGGAPGVVVGRTIPLGRATNDLTAIVIGPGDAADEQAAHQPRRPG
jgi:hypothetical protein